MRAAGRDPITGGWRQIRADRDAIKNSGCSERSDGFYIVANNENGLRIGTAFQVNKEIPLAITPPFS